MKLEWDFLRSYARFGKGSIKYKHLGELSSDKVDKSHELIGESIIIQIHNVQEHVVGTITIYGKTYQYILCENASVPPDSEYWFMFTNGQEPVQLYKG